MRLMLLEKTIEKQRYVSDAMEFKPDWEREALKKFQVAELEW